MAVTQNSYTGNGSTTQYSFPFPYLKTLDVKCSLDAVVTTAFTLANATTVQFNTAPASGVKIKIYRETADDALTATFYAGSAIKSEDLNDNFTQNLYTTQEVNARFLNNLGGTMVGDLTFDTGAEIIFEGATDDAHETKLTVTDPTADRTITLPNVSGTVVTTGDTGTVTSAMIADSTIVNADIANATITGAKLANDTVTATQIAVDSVGASELADNSVASANIIDGTIVNADIANTTITGAKLVNDTITATQIADDTITATQIAANAITASELADDAVDENAIADNAVTADKIAANAVGTSEIADAELTTLAGMQSGTASILAGGTALAATLAEINTVCDGKSVQTTISDTDAAYPTSGAVIDYVTAQLSSVGTGIQVISTESNFPNTQPGSGVVVSIADAGGTVVNSSGTSTSGRTVGNSVVTINNFASNFNSSTIDPGVRLIVSSTGSGQIYNYHKATLKEADLLSLSNDINDFAARYRTATNRTSDSDASNDDGDLFFDQTANKMYVYDGAYNSGGSWKEVTSIGDFKTLVLTNAGTTNAATYGSATSYDLKEGSTSGAAASLTNAQQLIVSVNGVIQKPNPGTSAPSEGFAISDADTIIFSSAPPANSSVFVTQCGSAVGIGTPSDNTISEAKIQTNVVSEEKLKISNAGSNGQFLSKQSGNSGGLTWASVTSTPEGTAILSTGESGTTKFLRVDGDGSCSWQVPPDNNTVYTHPNHSGEVTSTADGATVIASDIVDEDNLKVDNSPTNDYVLTAKSSAAGGLTWAAAAGGGAVGGGSDKIFMENGQTITTNYTIGTEFGAACNALTAGPITINNGITVTIDSGDNWTIV